MKLAYALTLALFFLVSAQAQDTPPATPPPSAQDSASSQPAPAAPVETVQPAIPAKALPSGVAPSFTQDDIRKIETGLKKQMMLVGMGSGVLGLLIGMMIGRKTAPRTTVRRF